MGELSSVESPLVRVQTQSILQDILGIDELGKNWSIRNSLKRIAQEGTGLFVLINHRDAKSYSSETTFIGINSAEVKEHLQNKNMLEVTVEFVSEIISCVKDKDNKIVSGDPEKIKKVLDTWKFSKDSRSNNPNWLLIDTQA